MMNTDISRCKLTPPPSCDHRLQRCLSWAGLLVLGLSSACCVWRTHRRRNLEA